MNALYGEETLEVPSISLLTKSNKNYMETGERLCSQKERSFNQHEVWKLMDKGTHPVMPHMGRLHSS
jgi:hypothetical protein